MGLDPTQKTDGKLGKCNSPLLTRISSLASLCKMITYTHWPHEDNGGNGLLGLVISKKNDVGNDLNCEPKYYDNPMKEQAQDLLECSTFRTSRTMNLYFTE